MVMAKLRPYGARVTVADSPVDQEETSSGIVIPIGDRENPGFHRGVVLHVTHEMEPLEPGTVIFFRYGTRIADVTIVDADQIIAYEDPT